MGVPQVVIVGRPNVGKSSIFNWVACRRLAIVDDTAGVTRDRMTYLAWHADRYFELVDMGGIGIADVDNLSKAVEEQIQAGIESADVILFVVDTRSGLVPLDHEVAKRLRYVDKPILCVANKTDDATFDSQAAEFYKLGRGKLVRVSTLQNRNREELLNMIVDRLPDSVPGVKEMLAPSEMKVAIVGRRNVGKSTFVNTLANAERMIVSEIPGTTRDSVDVRFELDGKAFIAIDTPGLKRSGSVKTNLDFYSTHRAERSVRYADVSLLFFDAGQRISKVDKQLANYIARQYKPCIFVVNKWDLMHNKMPTERWVTYLRDTFQTMWHVPIAFITGQTGKNMRALLNHTQMIYKQSRERIPTPVLNKLIRKAVDRNPPPMFHQRRPKIYYVTQVGVQPPTIVMVVNNTQGFPDTYRRYLLSVLRDQLSIGEVPIKLYLQPRTRHDERDDLKMPEDGERRMRKAKS